MNGIMGLCTHLSSDQVSKETSRPTDKDHSTNLRRKIRGQVVSKDSLCMTHSGEDFLTMVLLTLKHVHILHVNVALWEESPQKRPTMHAAGLHSLDYLQIVGIGRLHISSNLWKHRRLICI